MSLDGTEISILELTTRSKQVSFLKGFYVRFSGSYQVKNFNLITTHVPTIVSTFICCWVLT